MKNKHVLVTGADGFIGSHLTELLLKEGYSVKALSYYNSFNNWGWLESIPKHENLEVISGDIRDPFLCKKILSNTTVVFHLASLIAIPYSYSAPTSYIDTNVQGTLNICQAALELGNIRMIHTSTSEVYGSAIFVPIDEKHPKQPQSPYSASKIGADAIAMSFYNSFNLPITIARPFNTYGPRQSARAFIPSIISQIAMGNKTIKVGDLTPTRDMNYVDDICRGFVDLAECHDAIGKEVNISSNYEITMGDILELIRKMMKSDVVYEIEKDRIRPERSEVFRLWGDNTLINSLTGYKPTIDIEEGLTRTCEWFSNPEHLRKYKAGIYNL